MRYLQKKFSVTGPGKKALACCEACVYKRGPHADWCPNAPTHGVMDEAQPPYDPKQRERIFERL